MEQTPAGNRSGFERLLDSKFNALGYLGRGRARERTKVVDGALAV
jgi:hypothetical protein